MEGEKTHFEAHKNKERRKYKVLIGFQLGASDTHENFDTQGLASTQ